MIKRRASARQSEGKYGRGGGERKRELMGRPKTLENNLLGGKECEAYAVHIPNIEMQLKTSPNMISAKL